MSLSAAYISFGEKCKVLMHERRLIMYEIAKETESREFLMNKLPAHRLYPRLQVVDKMIKEIRTRIYEKATCS